VTPRQAGKVRVALKILARVCEDRRTPMDVVAQVEMARHMLWSNLKREMGRAEKAGKP